MFSLDREREREGEGYSLQKYVRAVKQHYVSVCGDNDDNFVSCWNVQLSSRRSADRSQQSAANNLREMESE